MYLLWILLAVYCYHRFLVDRGQQVLKNETWLILSIVALNHDNIITCHSTFLLCLSVIARVLDAFWLIQGGSHVILRAVPSILLGIFLARVLSSLPGSWVEYLDFFTVVVGLGYLIGSCHKVEGRDIASLIREITRLIERIRESGLINQASQWSQLVLQFLIDGCTIDRSRRQARVKILTIEGEKALFLPCLTVEDQCNVIATGVEEGKTVTIPTIIKRVDLGRTSIVGLPVRPSDLGFHHVVLDLESGLERRSFVFYGDEVIALSPPPRREDKEEAPPTLPSRKNGEEAPPEGQE